MRSKGSVARPPRVTFVINSLAGGGAERVMSTILSLSEDKRTSYDICLVLLDEEPQEYAVPPWLNIVQLDCRGSLGRSVTGLLRVFHAHPPDVTVSFLNRSNLATLMAARVQGHRTVISERSHTSAHLGGGFRGKAARAGVRTLYRRADRVIGVSAGVTQDLVRNFRVSASRACTIPNPVNGVDIWRQAQGNAPTAGPFIVSVGRLVVSKNHAVVIRAYALSGIAMPLLILGEGPERAVLQSLIEEHGLEGRVQLAGFVRNPYAFVGRATFYVSGSRAEGFPNALVEAMSLGVPVISSNCPSGPSEILAARDRHEIEPRLTIAPHGLLVPVDSVTELAEAMRLLVDDQGLRMQLAAAARERAAEFVPEAVVGRYWDVVEEALLGKRAQG
jgi:glycosyltransferase involved in cell wall biosynthesis